MNRIYLDNLFEFTYSTYKNYYGQFNKVINLNDEITKVKQNMSLNEKGFFMKYTFVDLINLVPSIEYDECVLINPICFNIEENQEWFNLLNCLLLILNDEYIKETNIAKKKFLETADKMYRKHMIIQKQLNKSNFEKISELTGLKIIIVNNANNILEITEYNKTMTDRYLVCYKFNNDYFPVWNFENKYFKSSSYFIKYLDTLIKKSEQNIKEKQVINETNEIKETNETNEINQIKEEENLKKSSMAKEDKKIKEKNNKNNEIIEKPKVEFIEDNVIVKGKDKQKDAYEELMTNDDYALYISEAVDNKNTKKQKIKKLSDTNTGEKKKSKTNKNIFVALEQEENIKTTKSKKEVKPKEEIEDSIFKKTEIVDNEKIQKILSSIKPSIKLEQLQTYALELNLSIVSGSTKDGKPKNKTKNELIEEIKNLEKNFIK